MLGLETGVSIWSKAELDSRLLCDVAFGDEVVVVVEAVAVGDRLVLDVAGRLRDEVDVVADCCLRLVTRVVDITIKGANGKTIYTA